MRPCLPFSINEKESLHVGNIKNCIIIPRIFWKFYLQLLFNNYFIYLEQKVLLQRIFSGPQFFKIFVTTIFHLEGHFLYLIIFLIEGFARKVQVVDYQKRFLEFSKKKLVFTKKLVPFGLKKKVYLTFFIFNPIFPCRFLLNLSNDTILMKTLIFQKKEYIQRNPIQILKINS